jgi:hypothetical protein
MPFSGGGTASSCSAKASGLAVRASPYKKPRIIGIFGLWGWAEAGKAGFGTVMICHTMGVSWSSFEKSGLAPEV